MTVKIAPFPSLNHHQIVRNLLLLDITLQDPAKIGAGNIPVAAFNQILHQGFFIIGHDMAGRFSHGSWRNAGIDMFANQGLNLSVFFLIAELHYRGRPEVTDTPDHNQTQHTDYHNKAGADRRRIKPDPRSTAFKPCFNHQVFHNELYLSRKR